MAEIKLIIPDNKLSRVVDMFKNKWEIPKDSNGVNLFSDNAWAKEKLKNIVIQWVHSFEKNEAEKALNVQKDEDLIS